MKPMDDYVAIKDIGSMVHISMKKEYPQAVPIRVKDFLRVTPNFDCQIIFNHRGELYSFDEKEKFLDYLIFDINIKDKYLTDIIDTKLDDDPFDLHCPIVVLSLTDQIFLNGKSYDLI